ncbi:MAG: micrococcal nuclease [Eubacteriales bacterium]|nr:micrococcal nuclease [Eubacteriales bacterium]
MKYADLFLEFQRKAREQREGLWDTAAVPVPSSWVGKQASGTHYIGNAQSKVFHLPACE